MTSNDMPPKQDPVIVWEKGNLRIVVAQDDDCLCTDTPPHYKKRKPFTVVEKMVQKDALGKSNWITLDVSDLCMMVEALVNATGKRPAWDWRK